MTDYFFDDTETILKKNEKKKKLINYWIDMVALRILRNGMYLICFMRKRRHAPSVNVCVRNSNNSHSRSKTRRKV